jgi:hypothetical protein
LQSLKQAFNGVESRKGELAANGALTEKQDIGGSVGCMLQTGLRLAVQSFVFTIIFSIFCRIAKMSLLK